MKLGEDFSDKSTAFAIIMVVSVGALLVGIGFFHPVGIVDMENDLRNWTTLVIEAGIGIFIAVIIVLYTNSQSEKFKHQQDEITNLLKKIETIETNQQNMINEQHSVITNEQERIKRWKTEWGTLILESVESIKQMYQILEDWFKDYQKNPSEQLKKDIIDSASRNAGIVAFHFQNISRWMPKIENYLNDPTLASQLNASAEQFTVYFQILDKDYVWESNLKSSFLVIDDRKKLLTKHIERMKKEIPQNLTQE